MDRAEGHDVHGFFKVLEAGVAQRHDLDDPGDGDRDLDRPHLDLGPPDHLGNRLALGDVADVGQHPFAGRVEELTGFVELLPLPGTDNDGAVMGHQLAGDEETQAARGAGDQGDRCTHSSTVRTV